MVDGIHTGGDYIQIDKVVAKMNGTERSSPRGHFSDNRAARNATTELDHYPSKDLSSKAESPTRRHLSSALAASMPMDLVDERNQQHYTAVASKDKPSN